MSRLDSPLQLAPVYKPKIWGRYDLAPIFECAETQSEKADRRSRRAAKRGRVAIEHKAAAKDDLIGEVWLTDDAARFRNGAVAGMTLADAVREYGSELVGTRWDQSRFPVLAKYIFTSDWLSVQVHPDDDYAGRHESGSLGKCEMWYIVRAERGARFLLGARAGVTLASLKEAFENGGSKEKLEQFTPRGGEAIFVPPGTVHALGPGLVLFEAEQNSDVTYRLDDFGRLGLDGKPRPLHSKKGLEVTRVELPPLRDLPEVRLREPFGSRRFVVSSRYFAVEELAFRRSGSFTAVSERVDVYSFLEGEGRVETGDGWMPYRRGDTWVIPPGSKPYRIFPEEPSRALKFYFPEVEKDCRRPLAARGVKPAVIDQICLA
jgi:mannose-6-phosphate isomerase